ncbi:hypothetical protein DPMN_166425 [Dreissena polymorpha]|uniref:Uncharacterized protein n=1 Tax=Dreissena polymorpha TaxID=45954 RepID=A0A9D4EWU9_DREPO|nr:hypothetical protein DPMN_166425 [Dreissena polymorpha]
MEVTVTNSGRVGCQEMAYREVGQCATMLLVSDDRQTVIPPTDDDFYHAVIEVDVVVLK